ncbi:MAG: VOC family protein [Anaerolineae bacterium]
MTIGRILTNLCSNNLEASTYFYTSLFNFTIQFESDWFVHLQAENQSLEIGIMQADHDLVPQEFRGKPTGMYITFVVDDCDAVFERAKGLGVEIVQAPEMTFYGQNRLLLKDPAGILVDVSSVPTK